MKKQNKAISVAEEKRNWRKLTFENEGWDIVLAALGFYLSFAGLDKFRDFPKGFTWFEWVEFASLLFVILFVLFALVMRFRNFIKRKKDDPYRKALRIEKIDKAVFTSLNAANAAKVRSTLRFTYGHVHEWNPINYREKYSFMMFMSISGQSS